MTPALTPSQTVGPFFAIGLPWAGGPLVVPEGTPGAVWIRGAVLDGKGAPMPDALIETWQADPEGRYPEGGADFSGFGRCASDEQGRFGILTVKPGQVPGPHGATQAPHIEVAVFARGLLKQLYTRIYFADEEPANEEDPVLSTVADAQARATLVAAQAGDGYRFDIRLQGEGETLFFAF